MKYWWMISSFFFFCIYIAQKSSWCVHYKAFWKFKRFCPKKLRPIKRYYKLVKKSMEYVYIVPEISITKERRFRKFTQYQYRSFEKSWKKNIFLISKIFGKTEEEKKRKLMFLFFLLIKRNFSRNVVVVFEKRYCFQLLIRQIITQFN